MNQNNNKTIQDYNTILQNMENKAFEINPELKEGLRIINDNKIGIDNYARYIELMTMQPNAITLVSIA